MAETEIEGDIENVRICVGFLSAYNEADKMAKNLMSDH